MNTTKKLLLVGMLMLTGTTLFAEETQVTNEVDTTYIKLDENLEPINYVNWTKDGRRYLRQRLSSSMPLATIPTRLRAVSSPQWPSRLRMPTTIRSFTTRSSTLSLRATRSRIPTTQAVTITSMPTSRCSSTTSRVTRN